MAMLVLATPSLAEEAPFGAAELAAFSDRVARCWMVPAGSEAEAVTVTVRFAMTPDALVEGEITLVEHAPADASAETVDRAFDAARRAVLRCQRDGYDLPVEAYGLWQEVLMTFNPTEMRS